MLVSYTKLSIMWVYLSWHISICSFHQYL